MPSFNLSGLFRAIGEAAESKYPPLGRALTEPALPEKQFRGTADAPVPALRAEAKGLPVRTFAPSVTTKNVLGSDLINPEIEKVISQTYTPTATIEDKTQVLKNLFGGFFTATPNQPRDVKNLFLDARTRFQGADEMAARDMAEALSSLTGSGDASLKATMLFKQMKIADIIHHMENNGLSAYGGLPYDEWFKANSKMLTWMRRQPDVTAAHGKIRDGLDELFNDMVNRGWITPDRRLEDYTPMKKINTLMDSLGEMTGEGSDGIKSRILPSQRNRPGDPDLAIDEGNLLHVLTAARAEYYRKVAEHELFLNVLKDDTLNLTRRYRGRQTLPEDVAVYLPGRGMIGSTHVSKEGMFLAEAANELDPEGKINFGGWILPRQLVHELQSFHPRPHTVAEKQLVTGGQFVAKFLTVYNPANTMVNLISDALVAMMGMPGEKARPLGFLRWYAEGAGAAKAFIEGKSHFVMINGKKVDVTQLLYKEGVVESTLVEDLSGRKLNPMLKQFLPAEELKGSGGPINEIGDALKTYRQGVELAPRIASGLEALERTGDVKEFGRIARQITLNYGPGAPKMTKVPLLRFMSPFMSFQGLATERMLKLATTEGSMGRTFAAVAAVPAAIYMWNNQNEAYRAANRSLPTRDKSSLHIILPGDDPSVPRRASDGTYVIIRGKYFVPEDVMRSIGLGNIPERVARLAEGRDTAGDFLKDTVKGIFSTANVINTVPTIFADQFTGKDSFTGREMNWIDRLQRLVPFLKVPFSMAKAVEDNGWGDLNKTIVAAATEGMHEFTGLRPQHSYTMVGHPFDADLKEALYARQKAAREWAYAASSKGLHDKRVAAKNLADAIEKLKRIVAIIKAEQGEDAASRYLRDAVANTGEWDPVLRQEYTEEQRAQAKQVAAEELNLNDQSRKNNLW